MSAHFNVGKSSGKGRKCVKLFRNLKKLYMTEVTRFRGVGLKNPKPTK